MCEYEQKRIRDYSSFSDVLKDDFQFEHLSDLIKSYTAQKDKIKRLPRPRLDEDFKKMMEISGAIGGLRRLRRQRVLILLTEYFLITDDVQVSARSVLNAQKKCFGRSVDNLVLNELYGEEDRTPGSRVGEIPVDENQLKEALKFWKHYSKNKPK